MAYGCWSSRGVRLLSCIVRVDGSGDVTGSFVDIQGFLSVFSFEVAEFVLFHEHHQELTIDLVVVHEQYMKGGFCRLCTA